MKFLQIALLFTFMMLVANVAAQLNPDVKPPSVTLCDTDQDCYMEDVSCFCYQKLLGNSGECKCFGLRTDAPE